jgi:excisionase family DNA binding protein
MTTYKKYFSKLELSNELGVSIRTIDNWIAYGLISYSKIGRRVIFSKDDIDEFVQRNKIEAIQPEAELYFSSNVRK